MSQPDKNEFSGMTIKEMLWDLKKQLSNLDEREIVLQRNVAVLTEQVKDLIHTKRQWRENWHLVMALIALISSILIGILGLWLQVVLT